MVVVLAVVDGAVVVGIALSDAWICDSAAVIMLSSVFIQPRSLVWAGFTAVQVISLLLSVSTRASSNVRSKIGKKKRSRKYPSL